MKSHTLLLLIMFFGAVYSNDSIPESKQPESQIKIFETITLLDGQTLTGYVVEENKEFITLQLNGTGVITLKQNLIEKREIEKKIKKNKDGYLWFEDPNKTRYLYSPSAFMLKQKEISFSQKQLLFSSFGVGITDHINVQGGAAVPFWFINDGKGFNFIVGGKVGGEIGKNLNVAGGVQTFFWTAEKFALTMPFGTVTFGDYNKHISLNLSMPINHFDDEPKLGHRYIYSISGLLRVTKRFAFLTENVFSKDNDGIGKDETTNIFSIAGRIMGRHLSTDIGLLFIEDVDFPLPWLDITYHW